MPIHFDLVITTNSGTLTADLRLNDAHGAQLAHHRADFGSLLLSQRQGLFDLRNYLEHYVEPANQAASMAQTGICIAEKVLGTEIFGYLTKAVTQRTLRIQLPDPGDTDDPLAAQLARIPWEIARSAPGGRTLADHNLLVRVVHSALPSTEPLALGPQESLRVLFVFAESRGSRPLAARQERRALQQLFEQEIYPQYRVEAHFLSHGVTRERLEAQIRENGGYHVVHWSGHGGQNLLELARPGGGADHLSGAGLLDLFQLAGGFLPQLFFLSACHSGDLMRVQDWNEFEALARPQPLAAPAAEAPTEPDATQPGYTSTAHALLQGGVPAVVAMRYAVGDDYSRELTVDFYRALLAYTQSQSADAALTTARRLRQRADQSRYTPSDHATPILYGNEQPLLPRPSGPSPALHTHSPSRQQIAELTLALHQHFVGRTWELAGLGADFIGGNGGQHPLAVLTGLGGMGKTALTAEALDLWEQRFRWVLLFQAKSELKFEATLQEIHQRLSIERGRYYQRIRAHPADAIYLPPADDLTGDARLDRMARNLLQALRAEPILLVLDNFEANLLPAGEAAKPTRAAKDPAWDRCLNLLATGLVGSPSRVLITSRWPLAALAGTPHCPVPLGPLPAGEAALYVRGHAGLNQMFFGGDADERRLVHRLLKASRFHPLLMERLARLATGGAELRPQLMAALTALETSKGYDQLPTLFTTAQGDAQELAYLEDALKTSIDLLIEAASPDARRLLWIISLANEPVAFELLNAVWRGEGPKYRQQWKLKEALVNAAQFPTEIQEHLNKISPEFRTQLETLQPLLSLPLASPLMHYLLAAGLIAKESDRLVDNNPNLACHEFVRERIHTWVDDHPEETNSWQASNIRLAYAEWLEEVCENQFHKSVEFSTEAGRRAIIYYIQAHDYKRLSTFASKVITRGDSQLIAQALIPHLEQATQQAPEGQLRWTMCGLLADALLCAGYAEESLAYYKQAASLAYDSIESGKLVWADISWIKGNWSNALKEIGMLQESRKLRLESLEAGQQAEDSQLDSVGTLLEGLRLDIIQGNADKVSPEIMSHLAQISNWWQLHLSGHAIPEVASTDDLGPLYISALDIARQAAFAQNDWENGLVHAEMMLSVSKKLNLTTEATAEVRINRAIALIRLEQFPKAEVELQSCLIFFQNNLSVKAKVLTNLATLFAAQNDWPAAIRMQSQSLSISEQFSHPIERAISHLNLSNYLEYDDSLANSIAAIQHQLAALLYSLEAKLGQQLQHLLYNYSIDFRRARGGGTQPEFLFVNELLTDPAFRPLAEWLRERQTDLTALQAEVDAFIDQARQAAAKHP